MFDGDGGAGLFDDIEAEEFPPMVGEVDEDIEASDFGRFGICVIEEFPCFGFYGGEFFDFGDDEVFSDFVTSDGEVVECGADILIAGGAVVVGVFVYHGGGGLGDRLVIFVEFDGEGSPFGEVDDGG